jgi:hypothetical protein
MSDLLCVPFRPGWQVGSSERRKLCRPGGAMALMLARGVRQPNYTANLKLVAGQGRCYA